MTLAKDHEAHGRRIGGGARDVSLPISSHYQNVPSSILINTFLPFQTHLKHHIIDIT